MSKSERTGNTQALEPPDPASTGRWVSRARRVRNEVGLYLIRGAATALGSAVVAYSSVWFQTR
ncbi:hypothetical protein AB0G73_33420 [Streptomyces sp. NPDC020719]|uniref:hypothetical protein n=1 Tax=Streptomyces sp. NPDC020719 TaxID=3154896 RepID=UPI0033F67F51